VNQKKSVWMLIFEFVWKVLKGILLNKQQSQYSGYVYFIQSKNGGPIKIGYSNNPQKRLATFQTSQADRLVILGLIPGDIPYERQLHSKFAKYRIRGDGEWFQPSKYIVNFINNNAMGGVGAKHESNFLLDIIGALFSNNQNANINKTAEPSSQNCMCKYSEVFKFASNDNERWCMKDGVIVSICDKSKECFECN